MTSSWYIIIPIAHGYIGISKQGEFFGNTRMDVIRHFLRLLENKN